MKKCFFVLFILSVSLRLFAQPTDDANLTPEQKQTARLSALDDGSHPSIIETSTKGGAQIRLDERFDWWLYTRGVDDNVIYFNVFHTKLYGDQVLNRYCGYFGYIGADSDFYSLKRIGIKLTKDDTDMYGLCGALTDEFGWPSPVSVTVFDVSATDSSLTFAGETFKIGVSLLETYQAYYELYSTNKKYKLVFYSTKNQFPAWYPKNIPVDYDSYLVSSYLQKLDGDGNLLSYGMDFNHVGAIAKNYESVYCASVQSVNTDGTSKEVGKAVFYIKGEAVAAKCKGVADADLIKVELADPGVDREELKQTITYKDATFNLTTKGYQEDFSRP